MVVQSVTVRNRGLTGSEKKSGGGSAVPRLSAREITSIETTYTSELGTFSWAWVIRADGEVQYRLSHVDGRRDQPVAVSAA